ARLIRGSLSGGVGSYSIIFLSWCPGSSYCVGRGDAVGLARVLCMVAPILVWARKRLKAPAVVAHPGGTRDPFATSSPRLAHLPPTSGTSSLRTSSSHSTIASFFATI